MHGNLIDLACSHARSRAAPFNRAIEDGLQKVAEECMKHCPIGALVSQSRRFT